MWYYNYWSTGGWVCVCVCVFSSEIWRSVASNHYLELGQILSGAPINLLPGERVLRISITILLIFPCAEPLCERERCFHVDTTEETQPAAHTHLFMLADTRRHRRLQNAHIGIFSRFLDLTCTGPWDLTYEHMLFNSETCWMHWAHLYIRFTSHRFTSA